MSAKGWFKPRAYPHFDRPVAESTAAAYVTLPANITRHAFLPFIGFTLSSRRYKPHLRKVQKKDREVAYASHMDAQIFAYYGHVLGEKYEAKLSGTAVGQSVLAYRRLGLSNIQFAQDVFSHIESMVACVAVALDIEHFFDTLDHGVLKEEWCRLLGTGTLPGDHFAVYKAITRFASVDQAALYKQLGIGRRRSEIIRSPICTPSEFRGKIRGKGLIRTNPNLYGIPQGSPISAVLSNIYMRRVDEAMATLACSSPFLYRRYCDDILIVCKPPDRDSILKTLMLRIAEAKLKINEEKVQTSNFAVARDGTLKADQSLQYLGFEFDGKRRLIRSQTIARFMRRMKAGVRSAKRAAEKGKRSGRKSPVFRRELYERYSHLGKRNFPGYAKRAANIMNDATVRRQIRRSWKHLDQEIENTQDGK